MSGNTQVFSQALLSGSRTASAKSVATAARERQVEIQRIEKTIEELALLFEQLNEQVILADPIIEHLEHQTDNVEQDLTKANAQLETGVKSAKGARRKKFWCLGIGIAILLLIVIIIVIVVFINKGKSAPAPAAQARMIKRLLSA